MNSTNTISCGAGHVDDYSKVKDPRIHYVGVLNQKQLIAMYKKSDYFIHLAWIDHCPNVVVDARACDCQVICSSAGGTREIAGTDAIVIEEEDWDYSPVNLYNPPKINFNKKLDNSKITCYTIDMKIVANKYVDFMKGTLNA